MQTIQSYNGLRRVTTHTDLLGAARSERENFARKANRAADSVSSASMSTTTTAKQSRGGHKTTAIKSCLKKKSNSPISKFGPLSSSQHQHQRHQYGHHHQQDKKLSRDAPNILANTYSNYLMTSSTDSSSLQDDSTSPNGGHHGHFAEVSFRWNYQAQSAPSLIILHEGRVVYCGQMLACRASMGTNIDDRSHTIISDDDEDEDDVYELKVAMRAGEDYDYFFEMDGERRYDFDCDFGSVEVRETSPMMTRMSAGQTIIANSIQIEEREDDFTDDSNATNDNNNSEFEWQGNGPAVQWPSQLDQIVNEVIKPSKDTMILQTTTNTKRDVVSSQSELSFSGAYFALLDSYRYQAASPYCTSVQQQQQHQAMFKHPAAAAAKRVHFWDNTDSSVIVKKQASF